MWYCQDCVQYYDTTIQDIPLKNIKDSRVGTYPELQHYPTAEEDDIWLPFVHGISQYFIKMLTRKKILVRNGDWIIVCLPYRSLLLVKLCFPMHEAVHC